MKEVRPILIISDDQALRVTLAVELERAGEFTAFKAKTAREAEMMVKAPCARFDAIILDIDLADGAGCGLCAKLRQGNVTAPIILLSASTQETDFVRCLDAGANDYLTTPFRMAELLARLRIQLRIFDAGENAVFTIGPYTFRPSAKLLQEPARNRRIRLTKKEVAILELLYRAGPRPVARQELLHEIWGQSASVDTHTLGMHISRVRRKMEPNARMLVTTRGGYRLDPGGAGLAA